MRVGMAVGIPTTNPRRTQALLDLQGMAFDLMSLATKAKQLDVYVQGHTLDELLYSIGTQLADTVSRNCANPEPHVQASIEGVKALVSVGQPIEAIKMYRELQATTGADTSLLTAKRYIDKLRGR